MSRTSANYYRLPRVIVAHHHHFPWLHRLRCPWFSQLMDDSVVEHFSCSHEFEHLREPPLRNHSRDSQSAPYLCFDIRGRLARSIYLQKVFLIPP